MADVKAAGAICYLQDGKKTFFLLLRSAKTGEWGPPKGHSEENESELETAVRELYEEAGIRRVSFTPGFREVLNYTVEKKGKMREKEVVFFSLQARQRRGPHLRRTHGSSFRNTRRNRGACATRRPPRGLPQSTGVRL
jgi:8-oxo-dGTP pyrophosphatase MutT (NUDIX family)